MFATQNQNQEPVRTCNIVTFMLTLVIHYYHVFLELPEGENEEAQQNPPKGQ